jgi:hypothetical protein
LLSFSFLGVVETIVEEVVVEQRSGREREQKQIGSAAAAWERAGQVDAVAVQMAAVVAALGVGVATAWSVAAARWKGSPGPAGGRVGSGATLWGCETAAGKRVFDV